MKCILYTSVLSGGGAERVLCQLANRLAEEHQVTIVASYPSEHEYELLTNVQKVYLDSSVEGKNPFKQILRLRRLIKTTRPELCISFLPQPNFKLLLSSVGIRTKKLISVRNDPAREYASRVTRTLAKILYPLANGVVFQTHDAKNWFSKRISRKSRVIMNQVASAFFLKSRESEEYYVATGRLNSQKNYPMMIRAFAKFVDKYPDEKLYVFGDGELREELIELISSLGCEKNVFLKGATSDVPSILARAKAFLLTSNYEGMPNGLLEAMAMGIPCISTDCPCGGPKEIINDHNNGLLIDVANDEALYIALCKIQTDEMFRNSVAQKAKDSAQRFHPDKIFQEWFEYMSEIITN